MVNYKELRQYKNINYKNINSKNIENYKINIMRPCLNNIREIVLLRLRKGKKGRPKKIITANIRKNINNMREQELKRVRKELSKKGRPKLICNCLEEEIYNEYSKYY